MITFTGSNKDVARFAKDLLEASNEGLLSITITRLEKSGVCSVCIATSTSSLDTVRLVAQNYSWKVTDTWNENTLVG